jgi:hypothetical protein
MFDGKDAKKLQKKHKAKSDVGQLLRTVSHLRPMRDLTLSNERLKALIKNSGVDGTSSISYDSESDSFTKSISLSRKNSGFEDSTFASESIFSEFSQATRLTQREIIKEIEKRAKRNRPPPEYVQPLHELHPSLLSWNRKSPVKRSISPLSVSSSSQTVASETQVNIIGCHHPIELILAKADHRLRKREKTLKKKKIKCEERVKEIDEAIKWKFTRGERLAAAIELKQRQVYWCRMVILSNYLKSLNDRFQVKLEAAKQIKALGKYAKLITKAFLRWYRRHIFLKVQFNYARAFERAEGPFKLFMRIFRKRRAIKRLKQFFNDYRGHQKVWMLVLVVSSSSSFASPSFFFFLFFLFFLIVSSHLPPSISFPLILLLSLTLLLFVL